MKPLSKLPVGPPRKSTFWISLFFACLGLALCFNGLPVVGGLTMFSAFLNLAAGIILKNH